MHKNEAIDWCASIELERKYICMSPWLRPIYLGYRPRCPLSQFVFVPSKNIDRKGYRKAEQVCSCNRDNRGNNFLQAFSLT